MRWWMGPLPETVYISNANELYRLSEDCALDTRFQGITVSLTRDIDLGADAFNPIPTFGGTFDGNGHTIKGLAITLEGSHQGLFRYLQKGGIIKNLSVEGAVTPGGSKNNIGGIVGFKNGTISPSV